MPSRASVAAVFLLLSLPIPGRAFDRAAALTELRAVQPRLAQGDQAPASLKAIEKTLSSVPPGDKEFLELKAAAAAALVAQGGAEFPSRVDKVRELLNRLFPAGGVVSAPAPAADRPPADLKGAKAAADPGKWTQALDGGQSRRFWDLDAASSGEPGVSAADHPAGSSRSLPVPQKGLKVAVVPATDKTLSDQSASCRQALAGHPKIASLCQEHPKLAPLIAGVAEAFKAQFGTIAGIATNLLFLLIGLVMSAISGIGLIAKIAVSLVSLGMAAMVLGPLIKEGWDAFGAYRRSGKGTLQESASLLRMGKVGGAVLILALMSFIGYKVGKSKPGQEAVKSMTAALSAKLGKPAAAAPGAATAGGRLSGALKEAIPAKDPVGLGHGQTRHVNVGEAGLLKQLASGKVAATEFVDQVAALRTRELAWAKLRAVGEGEFSGVLGKAGDVSAGLERLVLDGSVKNAGFMFEAPGPVGRGFVAPPTLGAPAVPVTGIQKVFVAFSRQTDGKLFIRTIYPKAN